MARKYASTTVRYLTADDLVRAGSSRSPLLRLERDSEGIGTRDNARNRSLYGPKSVHDPAFWRKMTGRECEEV